MKNKESKDISNVKNHCFFCKKLVHTASDKAA